MPRPAIVIGVGGTGQWVLSWLKKDLIETYGSLEGLPIRLLLLDVANLDAKVGEAGVTEVVAGGQYSRYAGVDVYREFIQLPTDKNIQNLRQIDDGVVNGDGAFKHISNWYCGNYYPRGITIDDGAGKFRQLGRLALVQGLHYRGAGDRVYTTLAEMVRAVARPVQEGQGSVIDVHIAGSLAGGSGSGVFMDIAWLLRKIIPANVQVTMMGFFAMPGVFSNNPGTDMRAKAFNAWRELNRILTVGRDNSYEVRWGNTEQVIYDVDRPAFDHVYLVDRGPYNEMHTDHPKDSVFPIMAEAISFYLDGLSGRTYIANVRTNLNDRKSKYPLRGRPTFSTLYVRSWKLPSYHFNSVARHKFAKAYLDALLQVEEYSETAATGEQRRQYRLKSQTNCFARAPEILDVPLPDTGSTTFLAEMARIMRTHRTQEEQLFNEYRHGTVNLLSIYAQLPDTPEGGRIQSELRILTDYEVRKVDPRGSRDEIHDGMRRAEELLYGRSRLGGDYSSLYGDFTGNQLRGDLYNSLQVVHNFHLALFRERLRVWMARELNLNEATSGLACVKSALDQLEKDLDRVVRFFEEVEINLPAVAMLRTEAQNTYDYAYKRIDEIGPLGRVMGRVGEAVNSWLTAETEYLQVQRDIRAIQRIIVTLKEMRQYVLDIALEAVLGIERQLVTDNNLERVTGLYRGVIESMSDEQDRHAYDQRLKLMMTLLQDNSVDTSRMEPDPALVQELVQNTTWHVDENMNVRVNVRLSATESIELEASARDQSQTRRLVERLVLGVADRVMTQSDARAIDFLNLRTFEEQIRQFTDTLFTQHGNAPSSEVITFYLRAQTNERQRQEIEEMVRERLQLIQTPPNSVEVVDSENPNKIVVFRARELLLPEDFEEWHNCFESYRSEVGGDRDRVRANYDRIRCDHLFAAEKNALELENRYYQRDRVNFPILNHRLVHLLENRERLNLFLQMWTLGWITIQQGVVNTQNEMATMWMFKTPRDSQATELLRWDDHDTLHAIERFVVSGRDFRGANMPYERLTQLLRDELNQNVYLDDTHRKSLVARYRAEVTLASSYYETIENLIRQRSPLTEFKQRLNDKLEQVMPQFDHLEGFRSLMEEFAFDMARSSADGNPLVSNQEAHLQGLHIMFAFLYEELAQAVDGLSGAPTKPSQVNTESDESSDEPKRPRRTR